MNDLKILSGNYTKIRVLTKDGIEVALITDDDASPRDGYVISLIPSDK